jgi:Na+-driven multidrug efflux pump
VRCSLDESIREAWIFNFREAMVGIGTYIRIAVATGALVCLEFWGWNLFVFMSAYISVDTTSSMTAVLSFMITIYTIPLGMSIAVSVIVGMQIGRQDR